MLTRARDLVRQQGVISVQEVALNLAVPTDVARALLQKWVDKGRIAQLPTPTACTGCMLCDPAPRELYHWQATAEEDADSASGADQSEVGRSTRVPSRCPAARPPQGQG
ncbi:MAG: FeoC-like transcriptional regulator [Lamprobacter sp.]|uniref:FeoC-like transcriptional regulator n=1 Tax=Lamprobacter sp. TaxID=3100796 RepID=UPI002B25D419|nr:FeoC-like transcriptional regulator [Lamprobacter sp.]MEA3640184.1 FeoC-like transcriptional regulator [Lamprobacter sp.]